MGSSKDSSKPKPAPSRQLRLIDPLPPTPEKQKLKERFQPRAVHGGDLAKGKRKTARPFAAKAPLHLILKSKRAKGSWSLGHRAHQSKIQSMVYHYGERFKVQVYAYTNRGNHLHLLVKTENKKALADFLRVLAGRVAVTVTGARRKVKRIGKFWDSLYWSRLVNWGWDFFQVRKYVTENRRELEEWMEFWLKEPIRETVYTKLKAGTGPPG